MHRMGGHPSGQGRHRYHRRCPYNPACHLHQNHKAKRIDQFGHRYRHLRHRNLLLSHHNLRLGLHRYHGPMDSGLLGIQLE